MIAFERNVDYQMSEDLKQAGGNETLERPIELEATLSHSGHVCNLRTQEYLGETNHIRFTLDPWQPSLFVVTREKLQAGNILTVLANELESEGNEKLYLECGDMSAPRAVHLSSVLNLLSKRGHVRALQNGPLL